LGQERRFRIPEQIGYQSGVIMPIYNVLTPVVALVTADSREEAMADHAQALRRSGHEVYPQCRVA